MLGDQQQNARIVEAVAGLGTVASNNSGINAGGDVYQVSDDGIIDQSSNQIWDDSESNTATDTGFINNGANNHDSLNTSDNGRHQRLPTLALLAH